MRRPTHSTSPKLSIGLPVYNGENFLEDAINSILNQTFKDFELIISDNASTDATEQICKKFSAEDERIRYFRNKKNLGAAINYNITFKHAKGEYFAWAAHDDAFAPTFYEKCVKILDGDEGIVLCFSETQFIDARGRLLKVTSSPLNAQSFSLTDRFLSIMSSGHIVTEIFGVIRSDVLKKTPLIAKYMTADIVLLAELSLYGKFYEVREPLFHHREHDNRSVKSHLDPKERTYWFDNSRRAKYIFPLWRRLFEHFKSIIRVPLDKKTKLLLFIVGLRVVYWRKHTLYEEIRRAV